jgi:hypothetical protein
MRRRQIVVIGAVVGEPAREIRGQQQTRLQLLQERPRRFPFNLLPCFQRLGPILRMAST